jgi:hypothetical protein
MAIFVSNSPPEAASASAVPLYNILKKHAYFSGGPIRGNVYCKTDHVLA